MTREEAIKKFEKQLHSAMVVLDSGFGTRPGECDRLYRERKELAEIAISALRQQEHFREVTKKVGTLTMEELSKRNDPVFVPINDFPNGGYWCLCQNGYIIPPSGYGFMAKDRPNWVFYSQKPQEGTV